MDELIVKYLRGEATDFETRRLGQWRAAAEANEQSFQQVKRLWGKTSDLKRPVVDPPPPVSRAIAEAEARRRRSRAKTWRQIVLRSPWAGLGVGAAAALVVLVLGVRNDRRPVESSPVLAPVESSSGPGDVTTMGLTDGSILRLAQETRVEFIPSRERREVALEGKAFFAVAHDPKPFVVRSRVGEVVVHGTGQVSLRGTGGTAEVKAGQVAFLVAGASPRVLEGEDVWPMLDWPGGLLVFQETPLSQVMREIGRHFGNKPQIIDEEIGRRRITAWFGYETLEEVIAAVCHIAGAHCRITESEVTVGR
jgi:transmembrane sensor